MHHKVSPHAHGCSGRCCLKDSSSVPCSMQMLATWVWPVPAGCCTEGQLRKTLLVLCKLDAEQELG